MKFSLFGKIYLISMLPILIGCSSLSISGTNIGSNNESSNEDFSSSVNSIDESNYFHYSPELVKDEIGDNCFIVKPLENGNDYKVQSFRETIEIFTAQNILFKNNTIDEIINFMPENLCEEYDIAAYRIHLQSQGEDKGFYFYYAFYCGNVIPVSWNQIGDDYISFYYNFLFTDLNNDGYKEISLNNESYLHGSANYILSIDTKTRHYIYAPYNGDSFKYFKIVDGKPYIYKRDVITIDRISRISLEESVSSSFFEYKRKITIKENPIIATCDNFEAKITFDEGDTSFPFYYLGLNIEFNIIIEMTYLGEAFHLYSPSSPEPGCYPEFFNDSIDCIPYQPRKGQGSLAAIVDIDINPGDIIIRNYNFNGYSDSTPNGVYNLRVIYRSYQVILNEVLTIEDK